METCKRSVFKQQITMTKMIFFVRANTFLVYCLIFIGAEARTLLEKHHGQKLEEYGREPYITPSSPASSPPNMQEIVAGKHDHAGPTAPKHDPNIGHLTSSSQGHKNALYTASDEVLILLPSYSSEEVVGRHDHVPIPPSPKPADEEGQIIITASSNSCHDDDHNNGIGMGKRRLPPPTPKPSDEYGETVITSDDHMNSNYGREDRILPPPSPHDSPIGQLSSSHGLKPHHNTLLTSI